MINTAGKESVFISGLDANVIESDIRGEAFLRWLTVRLFKTAKISL